MRNWLKQLRESSGMTQLDVSEALKISRTYYLRIENGQRKKSIDLSTLTELSKIFRVPIDLLIEFETTYKEGLKNK